MAHTTVSCFRLISCSLSCIISLASSLCGKTGDNQPASSLNNSSDLNPAKRSGELQQRVPCRNCVCAPCNVRYAKHESKPWSPLALLRPVLFFLFFLRDERLSVVSLLHAAQCLLPYSELSAITRLSAHAAMLCMISRLLYVVYRHCVSISLWISKYDVCRYPRPLYKLSVFVLAVLLSREKDEITRQFAGSIDRSIVRPV